MGINNMEEFIRIYGFKNTESFKCDENSSIKTILLKLENKEKKKIIDILYKNKICSLPHLIK